MPTCTPTDKQARGYVNMSDCILVAVVKHTALAQVWEVWDEIKLTCHDLQPVLPNSGPDLLELKLDVHNIMWLFYFNMYVCDIVI